MAKHLVEFTGSFLLMLAIGLFSNTGLPGYAIPFFVAAVLILIIYAGAGISGAHYNPAVTVGFLLKNRFTDRGQLIYIPVQITAALSAAATALYMNNVPMRVITTDAEQIFIAELVCTFALMYVILFTSELKKSRGSNIYGFAIGFTVLAGALTAGGISGAVFNPAVYFGCFLLGMIPGSSAGIYLTAQISGAAGAVIIYNLITGKR